MSKVTEDPRGIVFKLEVVLGRGDEFVAGAMEERELVSVKHENKVERERLNSKPETQGENEYTYMSNVDFCLT